MNIFNGNAPVQAICVSLRFEWITVSISGDFKYNLKRLQSKTDAIRISIHKIENWKLGMWHGSSSACMARSSHGLCNSILFNKFNWITWSKHLYEIAHRNALHCIQFWWINVVTHNMGSGIREKNIEKAFNLWSFAKWASLHQRISILDFCWIANEMVQFIHFRFNSMFTSIRWDWLFT